jgi:hypothetical protein
MYFFTYNAEEMYDGFGAQLQRIISLYLLTKEFHLNYYHTNIILNKNSYSHEFKILKDIVNESDVEKFNELFVELKYNGHVEFEHEIKMFAFNIDEINAIISNPVDYNVLIKICICHDFIDSNPTILGKVALPALSWIDSKVNEHLNIAVHIRRGDVSLTENVGRYVYIDDYIDIINNLTSILSGYSFEYNIYCDSISVHEIDQIVNKCSNAKITFHINTDVVETFMAFVNADILIAGKSSFSYSASFLRQKGIILYIPIQHAYAEKHLKLDSANSIIENKEKIYQQLK